MGTVFLEYGHDNMTVSTSTVPSDFASADLIDCPVNGTDTDDPNNVYTCKTGEDCCTLDLLPACCGQKDMSDAIAEQIQLWGILLAIIVSLSLLMWWCRTDEACCDVENPCLYKFGCKKHKDEEEDVVDEEENTRSSRVSLRSTKSSTTLVHEDAPPVDPLELTQAAENLETNLEPQGDETNDEEQETNDPSDHEDGNDDADQ